MRRYLSFVAAAVLALPCAAPLAGSAAEMPERRAGLWEMKISFENRSIPPQTIQQCVDSATDKLMNANFGDMSHQACDKRDIQNVAGRIVIDSSCKFGQMTTTSHAEVTGSFDSAYVVKVTLSHEGRPVAGGQSNMTIEAKWLGPCKAGQKAGDMIMPGGLKMNVRDLQKMRGAPSTTP
jgi:hypothetical protein